MGAGTDEDAVRALTATLDRFRGDPRQALGLGAGADAGAARRAFMDLCKLYHPAKFARFAPATVRLANEVFLAIKRAYETVGKPAPASTAPPPGASPRATTAPVTGRTPVVPVVPAAPASSATPPATRLAPPPAGLRQPVRKPAQTIQAPAPAPASAKPPAVARPPLAPAKPSPPPPPPTAAPATPARPSGRATAVEVAGTVKARERFETAMAQLREQKWTEARTAFAQLAAEAPTDPRYRAYLHYTRGWEAFQLGKDGEARAEWQRALAADPGLGLAKWALESTGMGR